MPGGRCGLTHFPKEDVITTINCRKRWLLWRSSQLTEADQPGRFRLAAEFAGKLTQLLTWCQAHGLDFRISQGLRTPQTQAQYYCQWDQRPPATIRATAKKMKTSGEVARLGAAFVSRHSAQTQLAHEPVAGQRLASMGRGCGLLLLQERQDGRGRRRSGLQEICRRRPIARPDRRGFIFPRPTRATSSCAARPARPTFTNGRRSTRQ